MADLSTFFFSVVGGYALLNLYALLFSNRKIFVPQPPGYEYLPNQVRIPVSGNQHITAVYLENPDAPLTILFSHGNAEDLSKVVPFVRLLHDRFGWSVLMYDYRGYGTSDGRPSVHRAKQDISAAWHWLTEEKGVPPRRIIAHGRSLGGGPSTWLAARRPVGGLILESTFVSTFRVKTVVPLLPWDKFNNLRSIRRVRCPVLIMHGTDDEIIPFWHGKKLYAAAPEPKTAFWIPGGHHTDYAYVAGEEYFRVIETFGRSVIAAADRAESSAEKQ